MIFLSRIWLTQIRGNEALGTGKYGAETRGISQAREPPNTHINAGKINHPGVILQLIHAAFPKGQPRWRGITARSGPPPPAPPTRFAGDSVGFYMLTSPGKARRFIVHVREQWWWIARRSVRISTSWWRRDRRRGWSYQSLIVTYVGYVKLKALSWGDKTRWKQRLAMH